MEVGSVSGNSATLQNTQQAQPGGQQEIRQQDQQQRQAELETQSSSPAPAENSPQSDSRVGSVINTQA